MNARSRNWQDLSTGDFAARDMSAYVAILPVAAIEQHGPHLPVSVDAAINRGILERALQLLPAEAKALVLPALPVGKSNEHRAFPGTLSLSYETLGRVWREIALSVKRAGCRKILFFNSHGGQPQLIDIVCRELRVEDQMFAVACSWFATVDVADLVSEVERVHGIHAGEIETSMMLHLHPELVDMSKARDFPSRAIPIAAENSVLRVEGAVGFGWQTQDLNPWGVCGDATKASAELGRKLVERAARALAKLIGEIESYGLEALAAKTAYGSAP